MVAVSDFGCGERERMVELAIEHGWIADVVEMTVRQGITDAVAVLATHDANPPGPLGAVVRATVDRLARYRELPRVQRAAGLPPYVVFPLPLEKLSRLVDADTANDLRAAAKRHRYPVLCMNADAAVFVGGVSPEGWNDT